ncbi:MAG TPA: Uma2 family endonuclease [Thermoanaerobaculia bacterium]|nr:Uma2 family endonuclease [Thermoanaerobaculia bacterium]
MTALAEPRHHYTYDEYLSFERDSPTKHEFVDGEIIAMAGGMPRHNALSIRIGAALETGRRPACVVFSSDQQIRVLATGRVSYPDVSMVCGPIERDPADKSGAVITNPKLLVEVLSRSTEDVDRISKLHDYQQIPSLQEYVLVSQKEQRVEVYRRSTSGSWEYIDVRDGVVKLASGPTIDLAALYRDLPD